MIKPVDIKRMIDRFGEPLDLISKSFGEYDPTTGSNTKETETTSAIGCVASYDLSEVDGTTVLRGDRKVIFGSRDTNNQLISPEPDDQIAGQGDTVSIVGVRKILSGGVVVAYICQVRE